MHALVLTTDAYGGRGGIALYNRDLLRALCSYPGMDGVTAVPRNQPDPPETLPAGLEFVSYAARGKQAWMAAAVAQAVRRRWQLVVCGHINLLGVAHTLAAARRCPLMLLIYGIDAWTPPGNPAVRMAAHRASAVVSISSITMDRFAAWARPRGTQHILPNAIHLEAYAAGPKPAALLERYGLHDRRVLLTLGRLEASERYKGVDEVLTLMPRLVERHPDLVYLVVGDGTDRARLEERARHLGVAARVVFAGRISEGEKADHYRVADAFVMPGRGEGFGFVFLEAAACGIPCVGSVLDGSREALRFGRLGVLVNPDDPQETLEGIELALQQPRGVVPSALDHFAYGRFEERTHQIMRAVLGA